MLDLDPDEMNADLQPCWKVPLRCVCLSFQVDWPAGIEIRILPLTVYQIRILDIHKKNIFAQRFFIFKCGLVCFQGRAEARGPAQASRLLTWSVILQQLPEQQITQHHSNNTTSPYITTRAVPAPSADGQIL